VVKGIALLTLLWNGHFQAILKAAKARGFAPEYVLMDSWYSGRSYAVTMNTWRVMLLQRLQRQFPVMLNIVKHLGPVTLSASEGSEILHFVQNDR
jgi:hypothetical protein